MKCNILGFDIFLSKKIRIFILKGAECKKETTNHGDDGFK